MCEINKSGHNYRVIARRPGCGCGMPHLAPLSLTHLLWIYMTPAGLAKPAPKFSQCQRTHRYLWCHGFYCCLCCKIFICVARTRRCLPLATCHSPLSGPDSGSGSGTETVKRPSAVQDVNFAAKRDAQRAGGESVMRRRKRGKLEEERREKGNECRRVACYWRWR